MFEQEFEDMLRNYISLISEKKKFSGLVKDCFPNQTKTVNLLLIVYNMGIAEEIENVTTINNTLAYKYVKQLMDSYGISRKNADWIVSIWCVCYGERVLGKQNEITVQKSNEGPAITEQKDNSKKLYGDNFSYSAPKSDGSVAITGFSGQETSTIILPNRYGNYNVTSIQYAAFASTDIEEAILTEGYKEVGLEVFANCLKLHQVILPNTVKHIVDSAFAGCSNLKSITLPPMLETIEKRSFEYTGLKTIIFPKSLYSIGKAAFRGCKELDNLVFTNGIKEIPDSAFRDCKNLKKIKLSEELQIIGPNAFSGCSSLDFINIPDSVMQIDENAFKGTDKLFIIQCSFGSCAEEYARKNKIKYQLA